MVRKLATLVFMLTLTAGLASAQSAYWSQSSPVPQTATGVSQPQIENGGATIHTLVWTAANSPATCTIQLESNSTYANNVGYSLFGVAQSCTSSGSYTLSGSTANYVHVNVSAISGANASVQWTYIAEPQLFGYMSDGAYFVPLEACGLNLTAGALAAASTTGQLPGIVRAAAGNSVLQISTTAAANTTQLDCDITPPTRLTSGRGVIVTGVQVYYGYQTTALTSITGPTVNSVTLPAAAGGAAAGTVVTTAGGTLTTTAGTSHGTPGAVTTSGQCYSELTTFGTPFAATSGNVRLTYEEAFAQSAAAATVLQICGVVVQYQNAPI